MEINKITKIHYIGTFSNENKNIIQTGDIATFTSHFRALLGNGILDFSTNYQKIYYNKDRDYIYNIKILNNVAYCIIFTGLARISDNCMKDLINHQHSICTSCNSKELFLLEKDFKILLDHHNTPENDEMYEIKEKIKDVSDTMRDTIDSALKRGQTIEDIEVKVDLLEDKVHNFNNKTKRVKNKMCMSNVKATIMIIMLIIGILAILFLLAYGIYYVIV